MTYQVDHQGAVRETTRDQIECKITLRADIVNRLQKDLKVMVYCASDPISSFSKVDIAFPHQVEIKINQDEFKGNLRGLKNKPGSTRPADITDLLRQKADFGNAMTVTYALTQKVCFFLKCLSILAQHSDDPAFTVSKQFRAWWISFRAGLTLPQKYYLVVNVVKPHSVEELVLRLKSGKTISKEQVIRESSFYAITLCSEQCSH